MLYDITKIKAQNPSRLLSVFEAAIDYGYMEQEKENPSEVPYFAEMTIIFGEFSVTSCVIAYADFTTDEHGKNKFAKWNLKRLEIDSVGNTDTFAGGELPDDPLYNAYDYSIENDNLDLSTIDNIDEVVDLLCKLFNDEFAKRAEWDYINVEYPNGIINLIA